MTTNRPVHWIFLSLAAALLLTPPVSAQSSPPIPPLDQPFAAAAASLESLVSIKTTATARARSAATLGTTRTGGGVVIDRSGLIVTIGYLILEAETIEVSANGRSLPASVVGYDHDTGLGLIRTALPLNIKPIAMGNSDLTPANETALAAAAGNLSMGIPPVVQPVMIVSKRRFAGYWEYMLDETLFTAPPIQNFGGAALIGNDGKLLGIGSLIVQDALEQPRMPGNMFVPVNFLRTVMGDLLAAGRTLSPPRPWLGVTSQDTPGRVVVARVAAESPAALAGMESGDVILSVGGQDVRTLPDFYQRLWASGPAGVEVNLMVSRGGKRQEVKVKSIDRLSFLRSQSSF
jgi:S1-C subfamily serine protease